MVGVGLDDDAVDGLTLADGERVAEAGVTPSDSDSANRSSLRNSNTTFPFEDTSKLDVAASCDDGEKSTTRVPDKTNTRCAAKALDSHATAKAPAAATGAELYSNVESRNNTEETISVDVVRVAFS